MLRRNGGLSKLVAGVCVFLSVCFAIYLYNDLSGQLKNTERTAERYRREQESVSAQLQVQFGHITHLEKALQVEKINNVALLNDVNLAKDELKQRCDSEKNELTVKLGSLQKNYQMLKNQHEDIETQFAKVQMEKETEHNDHLKQDEVRAMEYNQFKQEKHLEISKLRDSKANLEREKEQLSKQIQDFKSKLQSSLELVHQAETRQREAEDQVRQFEKLQLQFRNQQQQQQFDNHVQLNVPQIPQQQQGQKMGQNLGGLQGVQSNDQNLLKLNRFDNGIDLGHGGNYIDVHQQQQLQQNIGEGQMYGGQQVKQAKGVGNLADDILKSIQDKQKPIDADLIEEQQKHHQIIPPHDLDLHKNELGHQKSAQKLSDKVQEPVITKGSDIVNSKGVDGFRKVEPILPVALDNQMQPQLPVDDSRRKEQIDVPAVQPGNEQLDNAENEKPADDDEDDNYENDFDKENNEKDDAGDI